MKELFWRQTYCINVVWSIGRSEGPGFPFQDRCPSRGCQSCCSGYHRSMVLSGFQLFRFTTTSEKGANCLSSGWRSGLFDFLETPSKKGAGSNLGRCVKCTRVVFAGLFRGKTQANSAIVVVLETVYWIRLSAVRFPLAEQKHHDNLKIEHGQQASHLIPLKRC